MTDLNILSCNINGLNGPHKCTGFLDFLRRRKIDIVLVQESHLKEEDIHRCNNKFYEVVSHSSSDTKTKGVLILVRRTLKSPCSQIFYPLKLIFDHQNYIFKCFFLVKIIFSCLKIA